MPQSRLVFAITIAAPQVSRSWGMN